MPMAWIVSPPVASLLFMAVVGGLYWLAGRHAARSKDTPGKRLPYACGEDLLVPGSVKLSYQGYFRLALVFVVIHVATLVLATLPRSPSVRWLATAYLLGVTLCIDVLAGRKGKT